MLPYCYEQLERQRAEIEALGEEGWLTKTLGRVPRRALPVVDHAS
jgi:hypothetical protein